jgi:hypothetical protein
VRFLITSVAMVFVCSLGFLTVYMLLEDGANVLTGLSVIVVAILAFGIFGALTERH